jgi:transglutaminase-like putative cysteine protease
VKITRANVYNPDGRIYPLDPSQVKTSKPQSAGGSFFVSGTVCTQYVLPNVQVGSIIDYEMAEETYNPFRKDFFFPEFGFQDDQGPIARSEVSVTLPAGTTFYYSVKNFSGFGNDRPAVSTSPAGTTYAWAVENSPPMVAEPDMPSYEDVAPYMRGAVFKDWDRIYDWMGAMHQERSKASPELEKFTLDLVQGAKTDEEKAARIYHYVQKEIRYIALKVGVASGWGGYDANLTWKRRYGCCIDKSLLLVAMLKAAGIPATTIILNTNDIHETDFSVPQVGFDHAITAAEIGGRHVFLDSTNYDYTYPEIAGFDYGVHVLNIFGHKIDYVPQPEPKDNAYYADYTVTFSASGAAEVAEKMHFTGSVEGAMRAGYRSVKKEEQKEHFQKLAKNTAPAAELASYEVNNAEVIGKPFTLALDYTVKDYPQRAGDILIVKVPDFEMGAWEVSLEKRRYPLKFEAATGDYKNYNIVLPKGYEVVSLPEKIELRNKYAAFTAGCARTAGTAGNGITCSMAWERTAAKVPAEDYPVYKAFLEKAANYSKSQIFLRGPAAGKEK